jgi:hypothetical protein
MVQFLKIRSKKKMMTPDPPRKRPEAKIQLAIIDFLKERGWKVMVTHGNTFQQGFPDLYCLHSTYGAKWIEVKCPTGFVFTPAQRKCFPIIHETYRVAIEAGGSGRPICGIGIWILNDATEAEYKKLFDPPNWYTYLYLPRS